MGFDPNVRFCSECWIFRSQLRYSVPTKSSFPVEECAGAGRTVAHLPSALLRRDNMQLKYVMIIEDWIWDRLGSLVCRVPCARLVSVALPERFIVQKVICKMLPSKNSDQAYILFSCSLPPQWGKAYPEGFAMTTQQVDANTYILMLHDSGLWKARARAVQVVNTGGRPCLLRGPLFLTGFGAQLGRPFCHC